MKQVTSFLIAVLTSLAMMAQTPQSFKYQTVARNNAGDVLASQNITFRMTLLQGDLPGTVVYTETHAATTNAVGLATLDIGRGTPVTGSFASINWSATPIFLKTEIDPAGGSDFVEMGTSELLSVPYALYAENTANNDDADADPTNELQTISKDGQTVTLSNGGGSFTDEVNDADSDPGNELQTLTQNGLEVSLSQGGGTISIADNDNNPANELQQITKVGTTVTLSQGGGSFTDENTTYTAGSGLQLTGTTFSNTAPDQTVSITAGTGISRSGTYPSFTITNTAPDQTVSITPGTGITKSGVYPDFTIANSMPDQTVTLQATGDATVTGTYPNFTINANPTNELQTLTQNGLDVSLSQGGGTISVADNDNNPTNEYQNLSNTKNGNLVDLEISNGTGTTIDVADADADPLNELQQVQEQDYQVTLSQGGGSFMTGVKSYTQPEIDALAPYNGLTVHNATTNCINYYFINHWYEACGTCLPQPTTPNAGPDQIGIGGNTTTLAANTPVSGSGVWTIISGVGGTLGDPTSPTSSFTGVPTTDYILAWTISTTCSNLSDEVNIRFWSCGLPITDARDSKTYNTVQIGTQCWMAQNLNVGTRIAGTANPANNTTIEKYCYNNSDAQCDVYGGLYQWNEMMNYTTTAGVQGICPDGWHLPTDAEWCTVTTYLDATVNCSTTGLTGTNAGGKMKEYGTTHWISPNTGATNSSLFTALPGGYRDTGGSFYNMGFNGYWWSSSQNDASSAWRRSLGYDLAQVYRYYYDMSHGFSVRCLKDN